MSIKGVDEEKEKTQNRGGRDHLHKYRYQSNTYNNTQGSNTQGTNSLPVVIGIGNCCNCNTYHNPEVLEESQREGGGRTKRGECKGGLEGWGFGGAQVFSNYVSTFIHLLKFYFSLIPSFYPFTLSPFIIYCIQYFFSFSNFC